MISESWCLFSLFYVLISSCFVFRTREFVSAGITVECLLGSWFVSEHEDFILHHIQRTSLTLLAHSLMPLVYVSVLLFLIEDTPLWLIENTFGQVFAAFAIIIPLVVLFVIYSWSKREYTCHPIAHKLSVFCDAITSWRTLASDIGAEFKRVDKINLQCSSLHKVIATDNWIIKIGPYSLCFAHQSDSVLVLVSADTHDVSVGGAGHGTVQYLNIEVKTTRRNAENFFIRCNALDFKDLEEKIRRPITILPDVTFHRSRTDLFLEVFRDAVGQNTVYTASQESEMCIGCMIVQSNVKLVKSCGDDSSSVDTRSCTNCYCRPLWCIDCMGKWWISRQEQDKPETWLSSKCTCPVCRSVFCMQDIRHVVFSS